MGMGAPPLQALFSHPQASAWSMSSSRVKFSSATMATEGYRWWMAVDRGRRKKICFVCSNPQELKLTKYTCSDTTCRRIESKQARYAVRKNSFSKRDIIVGSLPRRALLSSGLGLVPVLLSIVNPVLAVPLPEMKEPESVRTRKLPGGVRVQDIFEGEGQEAGEGDFVEFNYVCRRTNGYFVYSTVDQFSGEAMPVTLPLDEKQIIKGLKDVLVGMKVGGKRRALIPPSLGYVTEKLEPIPDEFGPRRSLLSHAKEPLVFEVQLLKVF